MSKFKIIEQHPDLGQVEHIFANEEKANDWIIAMATNLYNAVYWDVGMDGAKRQSEELERKLHDALEEIPE